MSVIFAGNVVAAIRKRCAAPEWACFTEVRNGTGFARRTTRSADALAMNLYPSRGLEVHGFEVKVSRSDWLRELKDPAKAEDIMRFCDRWWVAVGSDDIVQAGELPPTWGLLVLRGAKLVQKTEAPKLTAQPMDRLFIASLLRNATENVVKKSEVSAMVEERTADTLKRHAAGTNDGIFFEKLNELVAKVSTFEKTAGVSITNYPGPEKIGAAVDIVLHHPEMVEQLISHARNVARRVLDTLDTDEPAFRDAVVKLRGGAA